MRKLVVSALFVTVLLAALFGVMQIARSQGASASAGYQVISSESDGQNTRLLEAPAGAESIESPNISFIDSPTATCYQPDPARDTCYLTWYYMSVSASPNYMISMTVEVADLGYVARMAGFFQTSMYAPYNMFDKGFKVACGAPGESAHNLGKSYSYTIRARASDGLKSANYGTVTCPPFTPAP